MCYRESRKHDSTNSTNTNTTTTNNNETATIEDTSIVAVQNNDPPPEYDDGAILFHEWYFTYEELRPLLLPIIFGGTCINPDDNNTANDVPPVEEEEHAENGKTSHVQTESNTFTAKNVPATNATQTSTTTHENDDKDAQENDGDEAGDGKEGADDDDWIEVEDGQSAEDDVGDADDELVEREGLGLYGPISIIEIGCGDVPLGVALAEELNELQRQTGSPAGCVVKRIVCLDYSQTVISMLQKKHQEQSKGKLGATPLLDRRNDVQLEFQTADARTLNYPDGSFQLVLEKGTLDAMLSDKETGAASSTLIVKQCARILCIGGYFVLISHLNAHAENGRQWLDELVIPGLRAGHSKASWEIEVHGEEDSGLLKGADDDDDDDDDEGEKGGGNDENGNKEESDGNTSTDSPGPAVYIIRKLPPKPEGNEDSTIPLRLFSY